MEEYLMWTHWNGAVHDGQWTASSVVFYALRMEHLKRQGDDSTIRHQFHPENIVSPISTQLQLFRSWSCQYSTSTTIRIG